MIVSHTKKFVFIHIQRTGGSSLINVLHNKLSANVQIYAQHGNSKSDENYLLDKYKDYFKFSMVRNPWERMLSWFLLIYKDQLTTMNQSRKQFEQFLHDDLAFAKGDPYFHYNQIDYITQENGTFVTDRILRFENYNKEIHCLWDKLAMPKEDIPKMNPSIAVNYSDYYTDQSRRLIEQKCKKDIDFFGYTF
ncbi:MAG: sulfotransferase family 2 domain-containing protein [Saprospiraceae bacterium]|nr:sulfotransferase family 2 domain-containing protein [Saprospiraceae bacterium]